MYETPIKMDIMLSVYDLPVSQADNASLSLGLHSPFHSGSISFSQKDVSYTNSKMTKQRQKMSFK